MGSSENEGIHQDVETIWKQLLRAAKLEVLDTVSHGSSAVSFIEKIVAVPETKDAAS
jgi:hypothetical protein